MDLPRLLIESVQVSKVRARTSKYEKAVKLAPQTEGQHQNEVYELMRKSGYFWNPDREEWKLEPLLVGSFPLIHK